MDKINISKIIIPEALSKSKPSKLKLNNVKAYYAEHGEFDKPVILTKDNILIDNYIRYLAAAQLGINEIPYFETQECSGQSMVMYVVGKFPNCEKEYTWKLLKNIDINAGDKVLVKTKTADKVKTVNRVVTVVRIFQSDSPQLLRHKPVIKKIDV